MSIKEKPSQRSLSETLKLM